MNDGNKTFAIVSGIVALLLVLALAFTVLTTKPKSVAVKPMIRQTAARQAPVRGNNTNMVRAIVRTPDMNQVKQSVTVRR